MEIFLRYEDETREELSQANEQRNRKWSEDKRGPQRASVKKKVKVPIFLSSTGVTVAGLSPGSVYSFTLQASHPAGAAWTLGQTQTAFTREPVPYVTS